MSGPAHPRPGNTPPRGNRLGRAAKCRTSRRWLAIHQWERSHQTQAIIPAISKEMRC